MERQVSNQSRTGQPCINGHYKAVKEKILCRANTFSRMEVTWYPKLPSYCWRCQYITEDEGSHWGLTMGQTGCQVYHLQVAFSCFYISSKYPDPENFQIMHNDISWLRCSCSPRNQKTADTCHPACLYPFSSNGT